MNRGFISQVTHIGKKPVTVVRDHPDRLIIEGVTYEGDLFRAIGNPEPAVLYAIRRDGDDVVCLTIVHDLEEAQTYFEEIGLGDSAPELEDENAL